MFVRIDNVLRSTTAFAVSLVVTAVLVAAAAPSHALIA